MNRLKPMHRARVRALLVDLNADTVKEPKYGVCAALHDALIGRRGAYDAYYSWAQTAVRAWPGFSGNTMYPIMHPKFHSPRTGFKEYSGMWTGEYGRRRMDYIQFLIKCLDEGL
jgi:hypothetical protein